MSAIAQIIEGVIEGDGETQITSVAPPRAAEEGCLVFVLSREGAELADASKASAVVAQNGFDFPGKVVIRVDNPRYALALGLTAAKAFEQRPQSGVHATAVVADGANLAEGVAIGPLVHVAAEVDIGRGTIIDPGCVIERNVRIGPGCRLHANVTICHGTRIGARVEIHPGTVIGSDGFGYIQKSAAPTDDRSYARYFQKEEPHFKVPQMGNVVIGDDVEIGANVTVDRGTMDATVIGNGAKIDNLVQIAHNVVIEDHVLIASQAGISGHTQISAHATVGGQAGIGEGVVVGEGALISAKCGLATGKLVPPHTAFAGAIGRPAEKNLKVTGALAVLPKTTERLRALEKEVLALRESIARQSGAGRTEP